MGALVVKLRVLVGLVGLVGVLTACGPSAPISPLTLTPTDTPTTAPPVPMIKADKIVPVAIRIPSIGVDGHEVTPLGLEPDHTMQVPPVSTPKVVGWYTGAPIPGNPGSAIMVGHVDGDHIKGLFYNLSELKVGKLIYVDLSDGETATFKVTRTGKYAKEAADATAGEKPFPTDDFYSSQPEAELHIDTCGGRYDAKHRNYLDAIVVFSVLVSLH